MITDIIDKVRLLFITEKGPYLQLRQILGFYPHDIRLYRQALVHKSVAYYEREKLRGDKDTADKKLRQDASGKKDGAGKDTAARNGAGKDGAGKDGARKNGMKKADYRRAMAFNNERLEYLGDAMLGAIVADILYKHYSNKQEGFLTMLRSKIVCRKSLNKLAVELGLDKLILHAGAMTTGHNSYMNGNAFEAFVGAIYLDRGFDYCYRFFEQVVFKKYIAIEKMAQTEENFKSKLLEWCQHNRFKFQFTQQETRLKAERGTPIFHSVVAIQGITCGTGEGYTKKEADQKAAKQALSRVKNDKALIDSIRECCAASQNE